MQPDKSFVRYHQRLLGDDYPKFISHLSRRLSRYSIRINTLKSSRREVERFLRERNIDYGSIPWCRDGLFVSKPDLDYLEHQLGLYYIQSADSMVSPLALDPKPGENILDLCSAPGGKTTHIAQLMKNTGTLVANDNNTSRIRGLVYNVQRCGLTNVIVTQNDAVKLSSKNLVFDRILVDAPCSDVGTARKNPQIFNKWDLDWVKNLQTLQKKMIESAYQMLKPGGTMVYSTCTTTIPENEHVIEYLIDKHPDMRLESILPDGLSYMPGLTDKTLECIRILPQHNDTGCFFIAKVVKDE